MSSGQSKPRWEHDGGRPHGTLANGSADADPAAGVAVYDSFSKPGRQVLGGTSRECI
jgi:hypothetical protein